MNHKPLPMYDIFMQALAVPQKYLGALLVVGTPFLVMLVISMGIGYTLADENGKLPSLMPTLAIPFALCFGIATTIAVIGCHRIVLSGPEEVANGGLFQWTGAEIRYIGWWLLLALFAGLISIPFTLILLPVVSSASGSEGGMQWLSALLGLLYLPIYYVIARFSLVLPSTAIGIKGRPLSWSWNLTHGNGMRLALVLFFIPFCVEIVVGLVSNQASDLAGVFLLLFWIVFGVVQVAILSYSYKFLTEDSENSDNETQLTA